jgi:hypothetical protein
MTQDEPAVGAIQAKVVKAALEVLGVPQLVLQLAGVGVLPERAVKTWLDPGDTSTAEGEIASAGGAVTVTVVLAVAPLAVEIT